MEGANYVVVFFVNKGVISSCIFMDGRGWSVKLVDKLNGEVLPFHHVVPCFPEHSKTRVLKLEMQNGVPCSI